MLVFINRNIIRNAFIQNMYFVVLSTELIRWTQAASGAAGRANVGHRLHLGLS